MNIAAYVAGADPIGPVSVFSLEMSDESLARRLAASKASIGYKRMLDGDYLSDDERARLNAAVGALMEQDWDIQETGMGVSIEKIWNHCRRMKPVLIVVDYLQLMTGDGENRTQQVSSITRGLKLMAKDLRVPVLALSQLSREPEKRSKDKRPQLSDLRESGSIEQDADVVSFVYREAVYDPERLELRDQAELIIAKQRNGPTGVVPLRFVGQFTRFENVHQG
jgi:replicative DNA helicase